MRPIRRPCEWGLYDSQGTRLVADGANVEDNAVAIGSVALTPRPGDYPNSMQVDFGGKVDLIGYAMSPRAILPGEARDGDVVLAQHGQFFG